MIVNYGTLNIGCDQTGATIQTVIVETSRPKSSIVEEPINEPSEHDVPEKLKTEKAEKLMKALVKAGLLTEDWQPNGLTGSERALVARGVCERLGINEVWQVFGKLWNEKPETLRSYLNKALDQKKSMEFLDKLNDILG